jgi:glyoxylase-like metal-dependent hydrolase (beta-lactamase superfamily II)
MAAVPYGRAHRSAGGAGVSDPDPIDEIDEVHEVYAVKYAEREGRRAEHFLGGDAHDGPMPMDYFVWAVTGSAGTWVIDTGFTDVDARKRQRRLVRSVPEALRAVGVDVTAVTDVVLTHLHYDHAGGWDHFPAARFHLQEREMAYATGRQMARPAVASAFTADHIADLVHQVFAQRVVFHDGDVTLAPGLSLHLVGGHTAGTQVVRVRTVRGWLVLASDASHYYENMETGRPFPIVHDVGAMLDGFDRLLGLASSPTDIVPGHDPLVLERYPPAGAGLEGVAVRLDRGRLDQGRLDQGRLGSG